MFVIEVINSSDFLLLVFFTVFNYRILPVTIHTLTLVEHRKLKLYIFMNKNLWTQFTITSLKSLEQTVDVFIFNADYKKSWQFQNSIWCSCCIWQKPKQIFNYRLFNAFEEKKEKRKRISKAYVDCVRVWRDREYDSHRDIRFDLTLNNRAL